MHRNRIQQPSLCHYLPSSQHVRTSRNSDFVLSSCSRTRCSRAFFHSILRMKKHNNITNMLRSKFGLPCHDSEVHFLNGFAWQFSSEVFDTQSCLYSLRQSALRNLFYNFVSHYSKAFISGNTKNVHISLWKFSQFPET